MVSRYVVTSLCCKVKSVNDPGRSCKVLCAMICARVKFHDPGMGNIYHFQDIFRIHPLNVSLRINDYCL